MSTPARRRACWRYRLRPKLSVSERCWVGWLAATMVVASAVVLVDALAF